MLPDGAWLLAVDVGVHYMQVFLLNKSRSSPIITAVVNMPVSEPQFV